MLLGKFREQTLSEKISKGTESLIPETEERLTSKEIHSVAILTTDKISDEFDIAKRV